MSGIEVSARGTKLKETDLPLYIDSTNVLDWLIDRKKIPKNWKEKDDKMKVCTMLFFHSLSPFFRHYSLTVLYWPIGGNRHSAYDSS